MGSIRVAWRTGSVALAGAMLALLFSALPAASAAATNTNGANVLAVARAEMGRPVCAGAGAYTGPTTAAACRHRAGFDAGTLTAYAIYRATGRKLSLAVTAQYAATTRSGGTRVTHADLLAGDLVFFLDAQKRLGAGIYVGYGLIIDAASNERVVGVHPIGGRFLRAVRYMPAPDTAATPAPAAATNAPVTPPAATTTTTGASPTGTPQSTATTPSTTIAPTTTTSTPTPVTTTPPGPVAETTGSTANTWTDYSDAGGTAGPQIPSHDTIDITCRLPGFQVEDGNTWWYEIASAPWSDAYYVSADAFYNNGATSGSLHGTPFVDAAVPECPDQSGSGGSGSGGSGSGGAQGVSETSGSVVHTWTDYSDAGGTEGASIPANTTVAVTCRVEGFTVADGNTWWYQLASSPWDGSYYASADAFYNNGETTGSLVGTPFYDPSVPTC